MSAFCFGSRKKSNPRKKVEELRATILVFCKGSTFLSFQGLLEIDMKGDSGSSECRGIVFQS